MESRVASQLFKNGVKAQGIVCDDEPGSPNPIEQFHSSIGFAVAHKELGVDLSPYVKNVERGLFSHCEQITHSRSEENL